MIDFKFTILIVALLNVLIGAYVLFKNRENKVNLAFSLVASTLGLWSASMFFYSKPLVLNSLIWIKIVYFFVICMIGSWTYFFKEFLEISNSKIFIVHGVAAPFFIYILLFTNLWIKELVKRPSGPHTILGPAYGFFGLWIAGTIIWITYHWIKKFRRAEGTLRMQLLYIFLGMIIYSLLATVFDVIIPLLTGASKYFWISSYFSLFFVGLSTFAITRYHLFEIRVILTELLVGIIGVISLTQAILARTIKMKVLSWSTFSLFIFFGYLLIKTTYRERNKRKKIEEMYAKLKKLDEAKTEFISIASHQLRTPLTAIKGYISMILEGNYGEIPDQVEKPMKNVFESNERLIDLVNDLLNVSRIESGKLDLNLERGSILKLISEVVEELKIKSQDKDVKIEWNPENLPDIKMDYDKIRQVVMNIVDNAISYTEDGNIEIEAEEKDDKIEITVSDTGEGMTEDEIEHLFDRFSRGKAGNKLNTEGAGLGLYVGKKFIKMHDGKIWAESKGQGEGSTFHIILPKQPKA